MRRCVSLGLRGLAVLAVLGAVAACSEGDNGEIIAEEPASAGDESADPTVTTVDPIERERAAVIEAHEAAMHARIDSAEPPDPDFPALAETHTEPFLSEWTGRLEGLVSQGLAIRYPEDSELSVDVLNVSFGWRVGDDGSSGAGDAGPDDVGDMATVEACIVDDGETYRVATGEVTAGGGVYTIYETATLYKEDGTWKLAERQPHDDRSGRVGCAAQ